MANYFFDCGTHLFQGFDAIRRQYGIDGSWQCWCFEANPFTYERALPRLEQLRAEGMNITFLNRAVGDRDGTVEVHCALEGDGTETSQASNTLEQPPASDGPGGGRFIYRQHVEVEMDDLATLLGNTIRPGDRAILKLDIEGSEFAVMDRLCETQTIGLVEVALVEWHHRFFPDPGTYIARIDGYRATCAALGTQLIDWA